MNERIAINLICIKDEKLLLVCKKGVWILPGGKPDRDESHHQCLERECLEEITVSIRIGRYFTTITGTTPHTGDQLTAHAYLGDVLDEVFPQNEISGAQFFTASELDCLDISEITRKIIRLILLEKLM